MVGRISGCDLLGIMEQLKAGDYVWLTREPRKPIAVMRGVYFTYNDEVWQ